MCDVKVHITRVRTGCLTCRSRKKKCDEARPICTGCKRNGLNCTWPQPKRSPPRTRAKARNAAAPIASPPSPVVSSESVAPTTPLLVLDRDDETCPETQYGLEVDGPDASGENLGSATLPQAQNSGDNADEMYSTTLESDFFFTNDVAASRPLSPSSITRWLDHGPSATTPTIIPEPSIGSQRLWNYCGDQGFLLLGHYLSQTSLVLSGGVRPENPFLSQIMPVAMLNDLIMHLVLTMSAVHNAVALPLQYDDLAHTYYNRSLAMFRGSISSYVSQTSVTPAILALGSLLLCFTETVRGDRDGAIFKHLKVADTLIMSVLSTSDPRHPKSSLENFLVEFYIYVVTLSLVSLEPQKCKQYQIHDLIQSRAHFLASESFVGSLCGCWIELLLLIPRINSFAAEYPPLDTSKPVLIAGDRMAEFATLHTEVLNWSPPESADETLRSGGLFYQHAILLYLYTSAFQPLPSRSSHSTDLVGTSVSAALAHLENIEATAQINTILCWPVAIVGSCLSDTEQRDMIRDRLQRLQQSLMIANITDIMDLLDALWKDAPDTLASPWRLHHLMKTRNLCFSFA